MENNKGEGVKELLFSGGAGAASYFFGYLQGLVEIVGKEHLRQYHLGGVSCGTAASGYFYLCINGELDMKYYYQNYIRKVFEAENRRYWGFFTSGKLVSNLAYGFWDLAEQYGLPINGKMHLSLTQLEGFFTFKKVIIDQFDDADDFAKAVEASCTIPFFTQLGFFSIFREQKCIDGGFRGSIPFKYENSQKIFLNVMPKSQRLFPFVMQQPKNLQCIDMTDGSKILFPRDYYVWDEHWADEQFLYGYIMSKKNEELIRKIFFGDKSQADSQIQQEGADLLNQSFTENDKKQNNQDTTA